MTGRRDEIATATPSSAARSRARFCSSSPEWRYAKINASVRLSATDATGVTAMPSANTPAVSRCASHVRLDAIFQPPNFATGLAHHSANAFGRANPGSAGAVALNASRHTISPSTFTDLATVADFKGFADRVREVTGGIPIGFKLSAQHIEKDIEFAVQASADYIILDGRGGGTGAAPLIFRDNISVPTIPALARARKYLDAKNYDHVTLIITGGLRTPADFAKALALGADGVALSNAAMQAIGCVGARMCNTNNCPAGIATQKPELRKRLNVDEASQRLTRFFNASVDLMKILARACGHDHLGKFCDDDLTTWKRQISDLSGVKFGGV